MKIEQIIIDKARNLYLPEFRVITPAELNDLECYACFDLKEVRLSREKYGHMGCAENGLCLNQFAYVAWAQPITEGKVKVNQNVGKFLDIPGNAIFMRDLKRKTRNQVLSDREVYGKLKLTDYIDGPHHILAFADFNFGNKPNDFRARSCFRKVECVILKTE